MMQTIKLIGHAIKRGSTDLRIRNHAAALASLAPPKDYLGQLQNIYLDAVQNWRYVKDPVTNELLSYDPDVLANLVLGLDGIGAGYGFGVGDCDCITAGVGSEMMAIGTPTRIAVTAPPRMPPGNMYAHVFAQGFVPPHGWVTVDPVVHPHHGFGFTPPHSRIAYFNLDGQLIGYRGNAVNMRHR